MSQKGNTFVFILIGVVIFLMGFVGLGVNAFNIRCNIFPYPSKQCNPTYIDPKTPDPSPTNNSITDWKTYTNSKIELGFQYHPNWSIKDTKKPSEEIDEKIELSGSEGSIDIVAWNEGYGGGCDYPDQLNFKIFGENQDICHWIDKDNFEHWNGMTKILPTRYVMSITSQANSPYQKNRDTILNILSTFKSLDQSQEDTTNWKTYTSTEGGYSIKYPADLLEVKKDDKSKLIDIVMFNFKNQFQGGSSRLITIISNPPVDLSIQQAAEKSTEEGYSGKYQNTIKFDRLMIDGVKALGSEGLANDYSVRLIKNARIYELSLKGNIKGNDKTIFNKIISTFKFNQ